MGILKANKDDEFELTVIGGLSKSLFGKKSKNKNNNYFQMKMQAE